jgi:dethiobiotin synthetase
MARGLFVAGTDTGVGKTCVAAALLRALAAGGVRAVGMKPVAAGIEEGSRVAADVTALAAADGLDVPLADRNPYGFAPAIAPHLAARDAGTAIDVDTIMAAYGRLARVADVVVVEGAGGVLVPLGPHADMLDVPRRLDVPVLLVVGIRLGCLNHALLSARAIRERGVRSAGWVANRIDPRMARADDNVAELAQRFGAPPVADFPWGGDAGAARRALATLALVAAGGVDTR